MEAKGWRGLLGLHNPFEHAVSPPPRLGDTGTWGGVIWSKQGATAPLAAALPMATSNLPGSPCWQVPRALRARGDKGARRVFGIFLTWRMRGAWGEGGNTMPPSQGHAEDTHGGSGKRKAG